MPPATHHKICNEDLAELNDLEVELGQSKNLVFNVSKPEPASTETGFGFDK